MPLEYQLPGASAFKALRQNWPRSVRVLRA